MVTRVPLLRGLIDRVTGLPTDKRRAHPHPVRRQAAADANRAGKS
jgi:hypothetical protein